MNLKFSFPSQSLLRLLLLALLTHWHLFSSANAATDCTFPVPQSDIPQAQCQALVDLYNTELD